MSLFKSRFAKLETFVNAKDGERTPDMLKAAQAELDAAGAKVILVPHSEGISSPEQLDKHIDTLKTDATEAKAEAKKAQDALTELKGKRVLDDQRTTPDAGKGGDDKGQPNAEAEAQKTVTDSSRSWNAQADRMGFTIEKPQA